MRKNIPCFIPTMVTIAMLSFATTIGVTAGVVQGVTYTTTEEEIVADTSEDHKREAETELVEYVESNETVETEQIKEESVDIVEKTVEVAKPVEIVVYYDVPLSEALQDHIFKLCDERGIDPTIIIAMIATESNYNSDNIGDSGNSLGLMQIQPRWHSKRMAELGCSDLLNAFENVTVGIDIFADLYDCSGSTDWALMAYNGGSAYADRYAGNGIVSGYVEKVKGISWSLSTYESEIW